VSRPAVGPTRAHRREDLVLAAGLSVLAVGRSVLADGRSVLADGRGVVADGRSVLADGLVPGGVRAMLR
jgi:hypothetical protein